MSVYQEKCEIFHTVNVFKDTARGSFSAYTVLKRNRGEGDMVKQYKRTDI